MSAMIALFLAAAAAPEPADPPSVPMDVAKARVEMVKTLLASAGGGGSLKAISGEGANTNIGGAIAALTPSAIAPLQSCTRSGPFTVSEYGVMVRMACSGSLPADATLLVTFADEKIVSVVAGPSAPALAGAGQ